VRGGVSRAPSAPEIQDDKIEIEGIDALPDSPVLDLKPFIPQVEAVKAVVPDCCGRQNPFPSVYCSFLSSGEWLRQFEKILGPPSMLVQER
jgi:hypothetical protein